MAKLEERIDEAGFFLLVISQNSAGVGSRKFTYSFDEQFRVGALPSLLGFDGCVMY